MDPPLAKAEAAMIKAAISAVNIPALVRHPRRFAFIFLLILIKCQYFTKRERIPENRGAGLFGRPLPYFRASSSHFVIY
jgi:hypothetical protein